MPGPFSGCISRLCFPLSMKLPSLGRDETDGHWKPLNTSNPAQRILPLKWFRIPGQDFNWSRLCHMPIPGPVTAQMEEAP